MFKVHAKIQDSLVPHLSIENSEFKRILGSWGHLAGELRAYTAVMSPEEFEVSAKMQKFDSDLEQAAEAAMD